MSKGDRDETPIQFSDPPMGTRGPRIPHPLNQPNWKYVPEYATPPKVGDWLFAIFFVFCSIPFFYSAFTVASAFAGLVFIILGIVFILMALQATFVRLWKYRIYKENALENETREKSKKKQLKRQKDYR
jgi:hypothetical protein